MIEQLNNWADRWLDALWDASVQGGVALLIVWGLCRLVPRLSPGFKVWLWRVAWFKFLLTLFWSGSIDLPLLSPTPDVTAPLQVTASLEPRPEVPIAPAAAIHPSLTLAGVLLILWLIGVLICVVHLVLEWSRAARLKAAAIPAQLLTKIPVLQSDDLTAPVLVGILRPAIIFPASLLASASPEQLRMMLAHELAHLQRRDLLWGWLPAICQTLFFFHPLLWLTRREWLLAQEMACDELALSQQAGSPAAYGNMLVDFLASRRPRPLFGAASIFETTRNLKRRIQAMKNIGTRRSRWLMVALLIVSVTGILPWRVVAQDKPEDAAKRIQQLEKENAKLRQELEMLKQGFDADQLAVEIRGAEDALKELRAKYVDHHPSVIRTRERLQELREKQAGVKATAGVTNDLSAQQRKLYLEELALAQKYADSVRKQFENGRTTHEELFRAQQQLLRLKREIAGLDANRSAVKQAVREEIAIVERLLRETKDRIAVGTMAPGDELNLQRELLKLRRELLLLE